MAHVPALWKLNVPIPKVDHMPAAKSLPVPTSIAQIISYRGIR